MADVTVRKDIVVRFITDMKKAKKDAQIYENQVGRVGDASNKAKGAVKGMGASSGLAMSGLAGVGGAAMATIAPIAAIGAGLIIVKKGFDKVIEAGKEAEDALTTLGVMFKSEAKGMEVYQKALERSVVTPYDPRDIVKASVQAQGYIGKAGDVFTEGLYGMKKDAMTVITDMAAFSGQTAVEASTALFRADLQLLDKYGADARRVYAIAKTKGAIGTKAFVSEFVRGMSEIDTWMGMSEKRSKTMSGIISTVKGNFGLIFTYLSGATSTQTTLWTNLKSMIAGFSDTFGKMVSQARPYLEQFGAYVGDVFAVFKDLFVELWGFVFPIIKIFFGYVFVMSKLLWTTVIKPVVKIITFALKLLRTFFGFLFKLGDTGSKMKTIMSWIERFTSHMDIVFTLTDKLFSGMLKTFDEWLASFSNIGTEISKWIRPIDTLNAKVVEWIKAKTIKVPAITVDSKGEKIYNIESKEGRKELEKQIELKDKQSSNVSNDNRKYASNDSSKRNSHNVIYNYNYFSDMNMQDILDQSGIAS
ncbi:MAG: hypothetical protein KOO69_02510 [Victivallales bacterium]|nr:hypothetical protein [Victivallales bacterium]